MKQMCKAETGFHGRAYQHSINEKLAVYKDVLCRWNKGVLEACIFQLLEPKCFVMTWES